jgi:hypothetical protein
METVSRVQVGSSVLALPPRVQEALGQLVGSAKEGLLALSVGVELGVLAERDRHAQPLTVGGLEGARLVPPRRPPRAPARRARASRS